MEEVYYILSGRGRATVDDVTIDVKAGDAITVLLHGSHGIYNNSDGDIELLSIGVSVEKGLPRGIPHGDDLTGR